MLLWRHRLAFQRLAPVELGQNIFAAAVFRIIPAFAVKPEKAVENDGRTGGPEINQPVAGADIGGHLIEDRGFHLAGDGPVPDHPVKAFLFVVQVAFHILGPAEDIGGADGFVGFLGVLGLGFVNPGFLGHVAVPEILADQGPTPADGLAGDLHAVGTHVSDEPHRLAADVDSLIEPLRHLHGALGGHPQFAGRFLLQRRCGERRRRMPPDLFQFDTGDVEIAGQGGIAGGVGGGLVADVHFPQLVAVQMGQLGVDGVARGRLEVGLDGPVFARLETLDFGFALANQPQGHRLHASRRTAARQLAPQHRRQREPDEVIQRPAGQIGLDQFGVQFAGVVEGLEDGALGDFVEDDAFDLDASKGVLFLQDFTHVPGNGLPLAVGVGGQVQMIGALQRLGDFLQVLPGPVIDFPIHVEVGLRAYRAVPGRQVPDVAIAGQHDEIAAQVFVYGFGLGRAFDDDDIGHESLFTAPGLTKPYYPGGARGGPPTPIPRAPRIRRGGRIGSYG